MTAAPETAVDSATGKPVRVQDDLFRFVNAEWLATAVIPDDRSMDGAFYRLRDAAEADGRAIVEEAAHSAESGAEAGTPAQLIGDLYRSFMDTDTVERHGLESIAEQIRALEDVTDIESLLRTVGSLRRGGIGGLFQVDIDSDPAEPDQYALNLYQGGLGLPDESYYRDEQHAPIRDAYRTFLPEMLALAGVEDSAVKAERVFELETALAAGHWDRVKSRDSSQTYNPKDRAALNELLPAPLWDAWLDGIGAPAELLEQVIVRQPDYFTTLAELLTADGLPAFKDWLTWQIVRSTAALGPAALVEKNFDFYGRTLSGTPTLRERWKRGVGFVEMAAGEALGRLYVEAHFPPAAKERMDELVANLLEAYRRDITKLSWMSEETKTRALEKLQLFTPKIGYPKHWRDYSSLVVTPDDLIGNARRAAAFELERELAKIGKPVDRDEWFMSPQTVNAYYNPGMNEIVFPAAILRAPFFDKDADAAHNYGGIGAVIGHEIGHGFDDQGSKYDGDGNLTDWWEPEDRAEFERRSKALIAQYDALTPAGLPEHHVNGALTVGENIGDLGGLTIALKAYRIAVANSEGTEPPVLDGFTGLQRVLLGWAQVWRAVTRDEEAVRRLAVDPHSPPDLRCNAVVTNLDAFHDAFGVQETDALFTPPGQRVRIW